MSTSLTRPSAPSAITDVHQRLRTEARLFSAVEWSPVDGWALPVLDDSVDLGGLDLVVIQWLAAAEAAGHFPVDRTGWRSHAYGPLYLASAAGPDTTFVDDTIADEVLRWADGIDVERQAFVSHLVRAIGTRNIGLRCGPSEEGAIKVAVAPSGAEETVRRFNAAELERIERALS